MRKIVFGLAVLAMAIFVGWKMQDVELVRANGNPAIHEDWQPGNAENECGQIGNYKFSFKVNKAPEDTWSEEGNTLEILNSDGKFFDWTATNNIGAVIVFGGSKANVWEYDPQSGGDTELYAPLNPGGQRSDVSHVTFCWNDEQDDAKEICKDKDAINTGEEGECKYPPSIEKDLRCGSVELTFNNPTPFFFSFDYQIDNESGHEDGTNPDVFDNGVSSTDVISGGKYDGEKFGLRYNEVDVDGRIGDHVATELISFPEDTGPHTVAYRLWRGAENDWYIPWKEVEVESDCEPNNGGGPPPTDEPTPTPTATPPQTISNLFAEDISCEDFRLRVRYELEENGSPVEGAGVTFNYKDQEVEATTNEGGVAGASYDFAGEDTVSADADGYPDREITVRDINCPAQGGVLGATTEEPTEPEGEVLGATTYADTGTFADVMAAVLGLEGIVTTSVGSYLYARKRSQK